MKRLLAAALALCVGTGAFSAHAAESKKSATITYDITLKDAYNAKTASVYLPYPMSDANQDISAVKVSGNYSSQGVYHDPKSGAVYLMATWDAITEVPALSMAFHVDSHYGKAADLKASDAALPVDVQPYLANNEYLSLDSDKIQNAAAEATEGKSGILEKARGVYEWTIKNTHRDPDVQACGLGCALRMFTECNGGGKCADISSVFVAVARAAGIPARDVFGIRPPGKNASVVGDFHCWAEFYLPETGWVMVDPADVRKAMLIEDLELGDERTQERTEFFWNGDNLFRIALNRSEHGVMLSGMQDKPIEYFMYPYAEIDGKAVDYFNPKSFTFDVTLQAD